MIGDELDVVVVGAGTAGANAAYQLARRGRRVLVVERRAVDAAGAHWVNAVLDRHFAEAELEPPSGAERGRTGGAVHLRGRHPRIGPTLERSPTVPADMALLGRRLRKLATGAGAEVIDHVQDVEVGLDARTGRVRSVTLHREGLAPVTVSASLVVDASGRRGVVRRQVPDLARWCPSLGSDELCSASDAHHHVADPAGAAEFLERHGARPGDSVTFVGVSGGFSTCAVTVSVDLEQVGILVGCLANGRYGTGPRMVADLCEREGWIGAAVASGSGVIPLRRPYARISAGGVALVGDAACQVFPAHGSGIGVGLIAGTILAEGVASADDPGDAEVLWRSYQAPFQARLGADLAGFDVLRRATTRLGSAGVDGLLRSGLMGVHTTEAGLDQRWATPPAAEALQSLGRFALNPRLARVMVPSLARAQALRAHVGSYPDVLDLDALARWERRTEILLGRLPR